MSTEENIARAFHQRYEDMAPDFGYVTRRASARPWDTVPEQNRELMVATVIALLNGGVIVPGPNADTEEAS